MCEKKSRNGIAVILYYYTIMLCIANIILLSTFEFCRIQPHDDENIFSTFPLHHPDHHVLFVCCASVYSRFLQLMIGVK